MIFLSLFIGILGPKWIQDSRITLGSYWVHESYGFWMHLVPSTTHGQGKIRSLGVSNFGPRQMQELFDLGGTPVGETWSKLGALDARVFFRIFG